MNGKVEIYAIFHLNLAFSSIEESEHSDVIQACYWPLLDIIEKHNIPLGIELTAYTLERIHHIDPTWTAVFRSLLKQRKCELLASGYSQIIGPLIPAEVNLKNLVIGNAYYQQYLGVTPQLAYINEQAVSTGLLDVYLEAGFNSIVMEWDNPYSHNDNWLPSFLHRPRAIKTASGQTINVIWNHAIAFQKLQRFIHDEISKQEYIDYLNRTTKHPCTSFPIYGSDAEVFNYRPGRYHDEATHISCEWGRMTTLFTELEKDLNYEWVLPFETIKHLDDTAPLTLSSSLHPISVKKQAKYNITRWGLSGKDDLYLNTYCFEQFNKLSSSKGTSRKDWVNLVKFWASDLRTHLTQSRFNNLKRALDKPTLVTIPLDTGFTKINLDRSEFIREKRLAIKTRNLELELNLNRGLSIRSLSFGSQDFTPICGTLSHGHFDHVCYGADYYSNHMVMERFRLRDRVADLNETKPTVFQKDEHYLITAEVHTKIGVLTKWYSISGESLECGFIFPETIRPEASFRLGYITLLNTDDRPWFSCHNGGFDKEIFHCDKDFDHGAPVSSIVSATSALGATSGEIDFGNGNLGVNLKWPQYQCAALPMVSSKGINNNECLNRLCFSLVESDETLKEGGHLPNFSFTISPSSMSNTFKS